MIEINFISTMSLQTVLYGFQEQFLDSSLISSLDRTLKKSLKDVDKQ